MNAHDWWLVGSGVFAGLTSSLLGIEPAGRRFAVTFALATALFCATRAAM